MRSPPLNTLFDKEQYQPEVVEKMDELELDQIIMFLRGNLPLKKLLKYVQIKSISKNNEHLRFSLEQLEDLKKNADIGFSFRKNQGGNKIRDKYVKQIRNGEKRLEDFKGVIPHTTYYRLKKDLL